MCALMTPGEDSLICQPRRFPARRIAPFTLSTLTAALAVTTGASVMLYIGALRHAPRSAMPKTDTNILWFTAILPRSEKRRDYSGFRLRRSAVNIVRAHARRHAHGSGVAQLRNRYCRGSVTPSAANCA